jgi:hypothetical protein
MVLHPWYVVTYSTLKNLFASADLAALWGCLGLILYFYKELKKVEYTV